MTYLDFERLDAVDPKAFQSQKPFPFVNPEKLLTDDGYRRLLGSLPDVSIFDPDVGRVRKFGQESHDRYNLEYREGLEIAEPTSASRAYASSRSAVTPNSRWARSASGSAGETPAGRTFATGIRGSARRAARR
jgi:hypothetical protein